MRLADGIVYIGPQDHTASVLQVLFTLQSSGQRRLLLVMPEKAVSFQSLGELNLLLDQLQRFDDEAAFVVPERNACQHLLRASSMRVFHRVKEAARIWARESA